MTSIHGRSHAERFLHAVIGSTLKRPSEAPDFMRSWLRHPIKYATSKAIASVPSISFTDFFSLDHPLTVSIAPSDLDRMDWNVRLDEEVILGLAVQELKAKQIFEIGTFNGQTTKRLAEAGGIDASVYTLDVSPAEVDAFNISYFKGHQIGEKFRGTPVESRVTQLTGDSMTFDFSPYFGKMDFVFVDAAHTYRSGIVDSRTALKLVRPGGVIFWHDFRPKWSALVHGIREATEGYPLMRLNATTFAVLRMPA